MDKEVQTTLTKDKSPKEKSNSIDEPPKPVNPNNQKIPVMISLNTLRKRLRRKKSRNMRRKPRPKKLVKENIDLTPQEKSGEQVSEAESFEYMPGHMYHQNQMKDNESRPDHSTAGNKSSLESSGPITTDSSKGSHHSLTKDLEKCVEILKVTLQKRYDDSDTKKKLIKGIVQRLINSKYRDDETTTEFLSGLTFDSKKLGNRGNNTTTSTSDANNTEDSTAKKPKKSILRNEKFNPSIVASTSQSAPNLFSASSEKLHTNLIKTLTSNTESDVSSRGKTSSENAFPKTSSEELYIQYLEALRREEAYKKHLKDKEKFLKQKLVSSETAFKVPTCQEARINHRLKDLMKDLTRNNYDDGSGDASKLEGGSSNVDMERFIAMRNQRSHSVFTLSSSHSEGQKRPNLKKKQAEREVCEAGPSNQHYCCCPHHYLNSKVACVDSSVQVSIRPCEEEVSIDRPCEKKPQECTPKACECKKCKPLSPRNPCLVPDKNTGEIKYMCLCNGKQVSSSDVGDNFMIYKCSKLTNRGVQLESSPRLGNTGIQCGSICSAVKHDKLDLRESHCQQSGTESCNSDRTSKHARRHSKSSQTNMVVNMSLGMKAYSSSGSEAKNICGTSTKCILSPRKKGKCLTVCEATRCLQTEISINPQIAEPSLSDINFIDDCAKLICENSRKVSIHSSGSEGEKCFSDVCTNSTFENQSAGSETKCKRSEDEKQASKESSSLFGNDYTIPIKGTNMTLTVNLTGKDIKKKVEKVSEGVVTDKICIADEATSAIEENKSTQCSGTIFVEKSKICMIETSPSRKSCLTKKHLIESSTNCNTFPKIDSAKPKPPFKRCNTDTGKLSICSCVQTDCTKKEVVECNNNQIVCDEPTRNITCENSCQVEQSCEKVTKTAEKECKCKETKTDSIKSEKCVKTPKTCIGIQKDFPEEDDKKTTVICCDVGVATEIEDKIDKGLCVGCQTDIISKEKDRACCPGDETKESPILPETCCYKVCFPGKSSKGPIIDMIQDITRRYSKTDMVKTKKNKCFSEIINVLNYLLETDESTDPEPKACSTSTDTTNCNQTKRNKISDSDCCADKFIDKSELLCAKSIKDKVCPESSDLPCSSDIPATSSDSAACKVLKRIKKECEKYHQKVKCRGRKCEVSSTTSVNCEKCKKVHHCACRNHKCKRSKAFEKLQKKCIAYNLILQTSESMLSDETVYEKKGRCLKNVIVKVPKRKCDEKKEGTRQGSSRSSPRCSPKCSKHRSRSCPDESSDECGRRVELATVREYLEQNRPDFVEKTSQRRNCLKFISERR